MIKALFLIVGIVHAAREQTASSGEKGWTLLGKHCVGYTQQTGSAISGVIDLDLDYDTALATAPFLNVAIYDDQPESWPSLTAGMSCAERLAKAKNVMIPSIFNVTWAANAAGTGVSWTMEHVDLKEHTAPREWYVVLASCGRFFSDVKFDLKFTPGTGVYSQATGPQQCSPVVDNSSETALGILMAVLLVIATFLGALARYFTKRLSMLNNRLPAGIPDYDGSAGIDMTSM